MCSPHIIVFRFPGEHVGFPAVCLATQGMGALLVFQNLLCEGIYSPLGFCLLGTQSLVKQKMNHKKGWQDTPENVLSNRITWM